MIPAGRRIFLCVEPVDLRRGVDGLRRTVRERFGEDASSSLYLFTNKRRDRVKLLWALQSGWYFLYGRLDGHRIDVPANSGGGTQRIVLEVKGLGKLLEGVPARGHRARSSRAIAREAREKVRSLPDGLTPNR